MSRHASARASKEFAPGRFPEGADDVSIIGSGRRTSVVMLCIEATQREHRDAVAALDTTRACIVRKRDVRMAN